MAAAFPGVWILESSENFDEYMKAVGVGAIMAKLGSSAKPTVTITIDGDEWTLKTETTFKNTVIKFKLGVPFDETTADDRQMKTTCTLDGNTLIQDQKGSVDSVITRAVTGNDMLMECKAGGVTATRRYKKK